MVEAPNADVTIPTIRFIRKMTRRLWPSEFDLNRGRRLPPGLLTPAVFRAASERLRLLALLPTPRPRGFRATWGGGRLLPKTLSDRGSPGIYCASNAPGFYDCFPHADGTVTGFHPAPKRQRLLYDAYGRPGGSTHNSDGYSMASFNRRGVNRGGYDMDGHQRGNQPGHGGVDIGPDGWQLRYHVGPFRATMGRGPTDESSGGQRSSRRGSPPEPCVQERPYKWQVRPASF